MHFNTEIIMLWAFSTQVQQSGFGPVATFECFFLLPKCLWAFGIGPPGPFSKHIEDFMLPSSANIISQVSWQ